MHVQRHATLRLPLQWICMLSDAHVLWYLQKKTPIKVGATAGLRLLPGGKADDILAAVKQHLADDYPFQLEQVTIIDGEACSRARVI